MRQWRVSRIITSIIDKDGVTQTTTRGILHTLVEFLKSKYDTIPVDYACIAHMGNAGLSALSTDWTTLLDAPVTEEELNTLRAGYGDLRSYITTVEDGLRRSPFITR
jgi:hypothetical protein